MGHFTVHSIPSVDAVIQNHMVVLRDLCLKTLGSNLSSLILAGSFGRGEGSVIIRHDDSIQPLRDYDCILVLHRHVARAVIEDIRSDFFRLTGLGNDMEHFSGEHGFSLTLDPFTIDQLKSDFVRDRDLRAYDLLHASTMIVGIDYSHELAFPADDIPLVNGLRLLYQKMVGLVGHVSGPEVFTRDPHCLRSTLGYECNKTFIEICTALTLLAGAYRPSYRQRADIFARHWRSWFPELAVELPELGKAVSVATQEKLCPSTIVEPDMQRAFSEACRALSIVHRFYVSRLYGIEGIPDPPAYWQLGRTLTQSYFDAAVSNTLSQHGLNTTVLRRVVNMGYQRMLRYQYARAGRAGPLTAIWQSIREPEAPILSVFLAAGCLCESISDLGAEPRAEHLASADVFIDQLPERRLAPRVASGWEGYRENRNRLLESYKTWSGAL